MSPRPLSLAFYAAATALAQPLAPAILRRRAVQAREDPARLDERLGRAGTPRPSGPLAWLHGVSVGESVSLLPLVQALGAARPDLVILVTSGTRTAAETMARRLPEGAIHQYVPIDAPGAVRRFLDHWRPDLAVFVESELWPNLILDAQARGVKLALVSARMTEGSAGGWARAPAAARHLLDAFDLVLPQDEATAGRLAYLGARIDGRLNLKRVGRALPHDADELARMKTALGGRKVVLAASTHPGEEALVAQAFQTATQGGPPALLAVVPRHPDRGAAVAGELTALGLRVTRRGAGEEPDAEAYVADTLGELGLFFRLADVTVMGGSFLPGIGGHNPLEPARLGAAILTGPHVFNAADIYGEMLAEVAAIEAADGAALDRHLRGLLDNPVIARRIGEAALAYSARQGAALDQALTKLLPLLPDSAHGRRP